MKIVEFLGKGFSYCDLCDAEHKIAEERRNDEDKLKRTQEDINRRLSNAMISPKFSDRTFENWIPESPEMREVLKASIDFVSEIGGTPGMIFTGRPGTGKNHLAAAIVTEAVKSRGKTALFTTALKLVRTVKEAWNDSKKESETLGQFQRPDLLVIDEVGFQYGSKTEVLLLGEIIHERVEWNRSTLLLTNLTLEELEELLGERIIDRFYEGGRCLVFSWESWRRRERIRR